LKILNISNRIPYPLHDGGAIAHYQQLKSLKEEGVQVDLMALNTNKHHVSKADIEQHIEPYCKVQHLPINTDLSAWRALRSWLRGTSYNIDRFYFRPFLKLLESRLSEQHYDLVQLENLFMSPYIPTIRKFDIPIVLRQHNAEYQIWDRLAKECKHPIKQIILRKLAKDIKRAEIEALQSVDAVIAITEEDKRVFQQMGCNAPIHVYGSGIDSEPYRALPPGPPHILYHLGSMEWEPNRNGLHWFLDEVWPMIRKSHSSMKLHIAGKGMHKHFSGQLPEGVINYGEVESSKSFISEAGICIVPIQSGSGLRIKIIEAMAAGRVVVSTSVGAQGLGMLSGEHFLSADSAKDFAQAISLLQDQQSYEKISAKAKEACLNTYDAAVLAKRLVAFYNSFLSGLNQAPGT
jgi:glycosyltransferase involved in cell wall biosynthesis